MIDHHVIMHVIAFISAGDNGTSGEAVSGGKERALEADDAVDDAMGLTIQPQPEPWIPSVAVLNFWIRTSIEPYSAITAFPNALLALKAPPFPPFSFEGARFFQKSEWLICPVRFRAHTVSVIPINKRYD